jgi:hypothetical protein
VQTQESPLSGLHLHLYSVVLHRREPGSPTAQNHGREQLSVCCRTDDVCWTCSTYRRIFLRRPCSDRVGLLEGQTECNRLRRAGTKLRHRDEDVTGLAAAAVTNHGHHIPEQLDICSRVLVSVGHYTWRLLGSGLSPAVSRTAQVSVLR